MIRCKPKGLCSWNFLLDGEGRQASLAFNWWSEQGEIIVDHTPFEVCKQGVLSGQWTLGHDGKQVATAQKASIFTRTFEIQDAQGPLLLRAIAPLSRGFHVERPDDVPDNVIATIAPDHVFTRRATIETHTEDYDFTTLAFSFWLAVLTWRRAAQNNAG